MGIIKLNPAYKDYLWGGTKLKENFGKKTDLDIVAESWELSVHPDGPSIVANGEYKGKTFPEYLDAAGKGVLGTKGNAFENFAMLIKFMDAKGPLSIQVHPDNEYAKIHENSLGKTESWYVLQADVGTDMVMGHYAKTKEEFIKDIEEDKYNELLNRFKIHKGDFFYIPAGTLHAICGGSLIYEAQQSSDVTYRVYDYHRKGDDGKERELHVQQSIDCTKVPADLEQNKLFVNTKLDHGSKTRYLKCEYLTVDHYLIEGSTEMMIHSS